MDDTRRKRLCRVPAKDTRRNIHFAECHLCSTRQRITAVRRVGHVTCLCRVLAFRHSTKARYAECRSLPTASTRQSVGMPCATCLPSALSLVLGKDRLCRVPVDWHSATARAQGKVQFSGSKPHPLIGKLIDRVHEIYTVSFCLLSATT